METNGTRKTCQAVAFGAVTAARSTRPRGAYAKTAARRAAIVDAARKSFAERSYDETSLRDIAKRAGMTHPGVLHHFRDKAELLTEVLRQRDVAGAARIEELKAAGLSPASALSRLIREELRDPDLVRLWATLAPAASRHEHPAHEHFVHRYAHYRTAIADGLRDDNQAGQPARSVDEETAATLVLAALDGLQVQALLEPALDIDECVQQLFDLLVPGVSADNQREIAEGADRGAAATRNGP
jgi:AcrR family transcriptional regulator